MDEKIGEWIVKTDAIHEEISNARQKLSAQAGTADQSAVTELKAVVSRKVDELELVRHAAQKDKSEYREPRLGSITKSASEIAKEVAAEKGIASVVDTSSPSTRGTKIPAGGNSCNITFEVTARMNAKFSSADPAK